MKNPPISTIVLILVAIGSVGYGYYQQSGMDEMKKEMSVWKLEAEKANGRADMAEAVARRQEMIANESRKAAEMAVMEARAAMARAEKEKADCLNRQRRK